MDDDRTREKRRALVLTLIGLLVVEAFALRFLKSTEDKALLVASMVAQAATLLTLLPSVTLRSYSAQVSSLAHIIFGVVMLLIPVIGDSPILLALQACLALFTLASRIVLGGCMFHSLHPPLLSQEIRWDWAFALGGGISVLRLTRMCMGRRR